MQYTDVGSQLPDCDMTPGSFGVEVRIRPSIAGDNLGFYGCRRGNLPEFYRYGAPLTGVKSWIYAPTFDPGSLWVELDKRMGKRVVRIVVDARDRDNIRTDPSAALYDIKATAGTARIGQIGIVVVNSGGDFRHKAKITWVNPKRFDGRAGGYAPYEV